MKNLLLKYFSIIVTIYLLSSLITTIQIKDQNTLLLMGFVIFLANIIIKPLLLAITFPINLLSVGLLTFVVNAWTIMIADLIVPDFSMGGFLNSLLAAFIIDFLYHLINSTDKKTYRTS